MRSIVLFAVFAVLLLLAVVSPANAGQVKSVSRKSNAIQRRELTPAEIFRTSTKSVVCIETDLAQGSGFVVARGVVVTNYHVIEGASYAQISVGDESSVKKHAARALFAFDKEQDLAILSCPTLEAPPLLLGDDRSISVGENVCVVGSPKGFRNTLSTGIVSAVRLLPEGRRIQTTAATSAGSSGGPYLDKFGKVIAVHCMGYVKDRAENLNFGIPVAYLSRLFRRPRMYVPLSALPSEPKKSSQPFSQTIYNSYIASAKEAHDVGDFEKAQSFLLKAKSEVLKCSDIKFSGTRLLLITRMVGDTLYDRKKFADAAQMYSSLLPTFESVFGTTSSQVGDLSLSLAACYIEMGKEDEAIGYYRNAKSAMLASGSNGRALICSVGLVRAYAARSMLAKMEQEIPDLFRLSEASGQREVLSITLPFVGELCCKRGNCASAMTLYDRAFQVNLSQTALPSENFKLLILKTACIGHLGREQEAKKSLELLMSHRNFTASIDQKAIILIELGKLQDDLGASVDASNTFQEVSGLTEGTNAAISLRSKISAELAQHHILLGQINEALKEAKQAVDLASLCTGVKNTFADASLSAQCKTVLAEANLRSGTHLQEGTSLSQQAIDEISGVNYLRFQPDPLVVQGLLKLSSSDFETAETYLIEASRIIQDYPNSVRPFRKRQLREALDRLKR